MTSESTPLARIPNPHHGTPQHRGQETAPRSDRIRRTGSPAEPAFAQRFGHVAANRRRHSPKDGHHRRHDDTANDNPGTAFQSQATPDANVVEPPTAHRSPTVHYHVLWRDHPTVPPTAFKDNTSAREPSSPPSYIPSPSPASPPYTERTPRRFPWSRPVPTRIPSRRTA